MRYQCDSCGNSGSDVTPGYAPNGTGYVGSRSDMPGVAFCRCTRCYEDDKTRACYPRQHRLVTLFDEWADLNQVICPWRSRFDVLIEMLPLCTTLCQARALVASQGFGERYPLLPDALPIAQRWIRV